MGWMDLPVHHQTNTTTSASNEGAAEVSAAQALQFGASSLPRKVQLCNFQVEGCRSIGSLVRCSFKTFVVSLLFFSSVGVDWLVGPPSRRCLVFRDTRRGDLPADYPGTVTTCRNT